LIRLPFIAGGLAIYFAARFLARRRRSVVRLRDGRRVRLLSSVALLGESPSDLLALEYSSSAPDPDPAVLRLEARSLVQTVAARAEYARCRTALVTVRRRAEGQEAHPDQELVFTFRRGDAGPDWSPTEGLE
jgi:hypothetical protein